MSVDANFEPELLQRYGGNAPRYTSYPTALQFHEQVSAAQYEAATRRYAAARSAPISLYVHVPFCREPCYYCACNKVIARLPETAAKYVARLDREIELRAKCFSGSPPVLQMHFGGGTPTYLSSEILASIVETIGRHFTLSNAEQRDYSIEIDPRTLKPTTLAEIKRIGFNRVSLGVQDFDSKVQRLINREQPPQMVHAALNEARRLRFASVNFDLIYGLPAQTDESFADTVGRVVAMRPDRIALYGYAHMPSVFKAQARFAKGMLPDASLRVRFLSFAIKTLTAAGYVHIGMDHFALPQDSLAKARKNGTLHRSFQGYTTHADMDLVNIGASAIGRVGDLFVQNHKRLHDYTLALDAGRLPLSRGFRLNRDDHIRADVIQQIMCQRRIDVGRLQKKWDIDFAEYFSVEASALKALEADALLEFEGDGFTVTRRGEYLLRNVALVFDVYARGSMTKPPGSSAI